MTIRFTCSSCQANLKAKDKYSGRTLNCPACSKQIIVPVDYYKILGVVPNASGTEIDAAYRKLVMQYHPDHNPNGNKAIEKFKLFVTAYETLKDSEKRANYDRTKPVDVAERTTTGTEIFSAGTSDTVSPSLTILALLKKAESGDAKAMRELSMAYLKGKGVEANFDRAFYWTEKAAQLGDAESQYELAGILRSTKKDNNKAFYWEQLSAEQGWAPAQYNLRVCFRDGLGIQPNPEKQFFWYQKAAENGLTEAKLSLAVCYLRGTGIAQDFQQALIWLHQAADDGNAEAKMRLGAAYIQGIGCSKDIQNGLSLLKEAAALGDKKAEDLLVSDEVLDITDTKDANDAQLARFKVRLKNKRAVMIGGCIVGALFGTAGGFMGFLIGVYLGLGLGAFKEAFVHELKFFFSSAGRNFVKESIVEGGIEGLFTSILGGMLLTSIIIIPKLGIIALFCPIIAIADIVKLQKELTNAY